MKVNLNVQAALRREMSDWRRWLSRSLVIGAAAAAGLTVSGFTWLTELALHGFSLMQHRWWWSTLLWTPVCTVGIVWVTRRYAAGAAGSGIPQVMAALDAQAAEEHRDLFVSIKISIAKILLTAWGLLAGLSLGREGPCVQIAAGVMHAVRRWVPKGVGVNAHALLVAGGAAGIAAAFNTPLAGVMFAIEELSRTPEQRNSGLILSGIVLAGLIAVSIFGNATYFGVIHVTQFQLALLLPSVLVAVLSGLAGGLFARLLIASLNPTSTHWPMRWRAQHPIAFAALCGLAVAVIGLVSHGATFGSGYGYTRSLLEGKGNVPAIDFVLKFVATWITTWSGVPAGIFAPALTIGASLGHDVAVFTNQADASILIALGMAGFLAAATQAPLTSFIIVMEMVDGHAMVLSLMACAFVASGLSRLLTRPLYPTLALFQLARIAPRQLSLQANPAADVNDDAAVGPQKSH